MSSSEANRFFAGQLDPSSCRRGWYLDPIRDHLDRQRLEAREENKSRGGAGTVPDATFNPEPESSQPDYRYVERQTRRERAAQRRAPSRNAMTIPINPLSTNNNWEEMEAETVTSFDLTRDAAAAVRVQCDLNLDSFYDHSLPVYAHRQHILKLIDENSIVLIKGGTGSGKTTQVPQYIMDQCHSRGVPFKCVVTQPRRIAALSICAYVNKIRRLPEGRLIGYHVGLDRNATPETELTYMTTGVLLKMLVERKTLNDFTHIVLDEIHERDQDTDFVMLLVKKLRNVSNVKVILMSATCDSQMFQNYFKYTDGYQAVRCPPCIDIEAQMFEVQVKYLDDIVNEGYVKHVDFSGLRFDLDNPTIEPCQVAAAVKLIRKFDEMEAKLMCKNNNRQSVPDKGAVLIFLPGLSDIFDVHFKLEAESREYDNWKIIMLHSELPLSDQRQVFDKVEPGCRKIILSTNIAESSITVSDVLYVIDFCLSKEMVYEKKSSFQQLKVIWASKSSCDQRKGRAGRVRAGYCFRLVTRSHYNQLRDHSLCELRRAPLDSVILHVKAFDMGTPEELLANAIEPPDFRDVKAALLSLKQLGALTMHKITISSRSKSPKAHLSWVDGELTFLGKIMSVLPMDVRLSKLVVFGWVFGVLEECITIAACLNDRGLFVDPLPKKLESFEKRHEWARGTCSDLLAMLHVYQSYHETFEETQEKVNTAQQREWCFQNFVELKKIRTIKTLCDKIRSLLAREEIFPHSEFEDENLNHDVRLRNLKLAICGAFYPLYFVSKAPDAYVAQSEALDWPAKQVVKFGGLPNDLKIEELACIKYQLDNLFSACLKHCPKIELHLRDTKLYAVFDSPGIDSSLIKNQINRAVYLALRLRFCGKNARPRLNFTKLDNKTINHLNDASLYTTFNVSSLDPEMEVVDDGILDRSSNYRRGLILKGSARERNGVKIELDEVAIPVVPQFAFTPYLFAVQKADHEGADKLKKIESILEEIRREGKDTISVPKRSLVKGVLCLCRDTSAAESSDVLNRCEIVEVKGKECRVLFVDYGNVASVPNKSLKEIFPEYEELRTIPFQSFNVRLLNVKNNSNDRESMEDVWGRIDELYFTGYSFEVVVYSVTDGSVVHGDLFAYPPTLTDERKNPIFDKDPEEFFVRNFKNGCVSLREYALTKGYVVESEESDASKRNHTERRQYLKQKCHGEAIESFNSSKRSLEWNSIRRRGEVELYGPHSPLELGFSGITRECTSTFQSVKVASDSVNCISLDENPDLEEEKLLVAAQVQISERDQSKMLRSTTLMPKQQGFLELACLMFASRVKIRSNKSVTSQAGALCMLGTYEDANGTTLPVNKNNDVFVPFGVEFSDTDFCALNQVRWRFNALLGHVSPHYRPDTNGQRKLIKEIRRLSEVLLKKRRQVNILGGQSAIDDPYEWRTRKSETYYKPQTDALNSVCTMEEFYWTDALNEPYAYFKEIMTLKLKVESE